MCNACIMENVRASVRAHPEAYERAGKASARAIAAGASAARGTLSASTGRVTDLTHVYDENFPTFDGPPGITMKQVADFAGDGYNLLRLTIFEHTGTHVDAPLHFSADGAALEVLDPQQLICPLCVIDISARAHEDANAALSAHDVEKWMSANGAIPAGACVAMFSGWAARVNDASFRNTPDGNLAFPGFGTDATDLLAEMDVAAIAVDTLSIDPGNTPDFAVHLSWLGRGRYAIECLNNLNKLPATGATVFVGAPTHRGGTGGPARILAVV